MENSCPIFSLEPPIYIIDIFVIDWLIDLLYEWRVNIFVHKIHNILLIQLIGWSTHLQGFYCFTTLPLFYTFSPFFVTSLLFSRFLSIVFHTQAHAFISIMYLLHGFWSNWKMHGDALFCTQTYKYIDKHKYVYNKKNVLIIFRNEISGDTIPLDMNICTFNSIGWYSIVQYNFVIR